MSKSVYSLVLSDEVVREIDKLAYQNSTNRSGIVNQILADAVSYDTPEKRMHEVFERMEALLLHEDVGKSSFQLQSLPSDTMFSFRSAIAFKYNPTVRYSVELYRQREEDGSIGELRVSLRTQNKQLIACMNDFYNLWHSIECEHFNNIEARGDGEKYIRKLKLQVNGEGTGDISGLTVGDVISSYVSTFDQSLKKYFELAGSGKDPERPIEAIYKTYTMGEVYV